MRKSRFSRNTLIKHPIKVAVLVVGCLILAIFITSLNHKKQTTIIPSTNPPTKATNANNSKTNAAVPSSPVNGTSSSSSATNSKTTPETSGPIVAPYGNFVSNHSPVLSDANMSQEYSVCNTTVGASCYIEFTKGGLVKKLAAKVIDSSGSAYWQWNINDAGLSAGDWTITAVASSSGQSLSTDDRIPLSVTK